MRQWDRYFVPQNVYVVNNIAVEKNCPQCKFVYGMQQSVKFGICIDLFKLDFCSDVQLIATRFTQLPTTFA